MSEVDEFEEMIQRIMKERNCTREEAKKEFEPLRQAMKDAQTVFDGYPQQEEDEWIDDGFSEEDFEQACKDVT